MCLSLFRSFSIEHYEVMWTLVINIWITIHCHLPSLNGTIARFAIVIIIIARLDSFCSCICPLKTIISCSVNLWNGSSLNSAAPQKSQVSTQARESHPQHEVSSHVLNEGIIKIHQRQHRLRRPQPRTSGERRCDGPRWIKKMKDQGVCCLPESCCVASSQHPWKSSIWRKLRGSVTEH